LKEGSPKALNNQITDDKNEEYNSEMGHSHGFSDCDDKSCHENEDENEK